MIGATWPRKLIVPTSGQQRSLEQGESPCTREMMRKGFRKEVRGILVGAFLVGCPEGALRWEVVLLFWARGSKNFCELEPARWTSLLLCPQPSSEA